MKTSAAYIRVSTEDQAEYSPESQIKALRSYALSHNLHLPDKYIFLDEGISGRSTRKRDGFIRMISLAKTVPKPFDVILVWKYSRFARNREDSVVYKSMLRKQCGIDVVSISENVGDDKMSVLFEAMIEAMDEYYSVNLAEEVKRGMTEKAKRGGVLSIPAFGYIVKDGKFEIHSGQAEIIRKVFNDFSKGKSMPEIAGELNLLNVKTNRGNPIEKRTVEYWLNNPVYTGKIRWNPNGRTGRNYNEEGIIITDSCHEAIIDAKIWDEVQIRLKETKEHYRKHMRDSGKAGDLSHWLTGLLRCGKCGGAMGYYNGFYGCHKKGRGKCSGCGTISAAIAEDIVLRGLRSVMTPEKSRQIVAAASDNNDEQAAPSAHDILSRQLKKAEERLKRVRAAYAAGVDNLQEYTENKNKIKQEIKELGNQINLLRTDEMQGLTEGEDGGFMGVADILTHNAIGNSAKRALLGSMVKEIVKVKPASRELKIVFWER